MSDTRDDLARGDGPEDDVHADAAAYALDALDDAARARFEEHLATCADCRAEVADLQEAAAALLLAEPSPAPPPSLRAAVLAAVRDVEQLPPVERHLRSASTGGSAASPRPRRALVEDGADLRDEDADESDDADRAQGDGAGRTTGGGADPVVDELALRRANRRTRLLSVLVAAVTVVALALGFTVWGLARQQAPVAGPAPSSTLAGVDPSLLAAPDVRVYATTVNGAAASFVVSKSQDRAVFVSADLPAPTAGDVYHLWTLEGTAVRPDTTFTASGTATQELSGPIDSSTALAINVEPSGTDPQTPTTPVLAAVEL